MKVAILIAAMFLEARSRQADNQGTARSCKASIRDYYSYRCGQRRRNDRLLAQQLRLKKSPRRVHGDYRKGSSAGDRASPLDLNLVAAGRCRDTLDKLVGYKGSPLLWKLNNGAKAWVGYKVQPFIFSLCQRGGISSCRIIGARRQRFQAYTTQEARTAEYETDSNTSDDAEENKSNQCGVSGSAVGSEARFVHGARL